jgi:integrase
MMEIEPNSAVAVRTWSRRKKDAAPRGIFRHPSGVWAIRYVCGAGCGKHEERIGPIKSEAIREYHARRARAHSEPGWCPARERREARNRARQEHARQRGRITFADYANEYLAWCQQTDAAGQVRKRSWRTIKAELSRLRPAFGVKFLDEITTAAVEKFIEGLLSEVSQATANRYRDRLSGMFKRAVRLGLVTTNPVASVPKFRETGGRVVCLTETQEQAIRDALSPEMRPYLDFALNTGFRWSKQMDLRWLDIDLLTKTLTIGKDKNGQALRVPFNSDVDRVVLEMGTRRKRPTDPHEPVFPRRYREPDKFFPRAVQRAREALREAGHHDEAAGLDGVSWHGLRHTWASRLTMAGVDPRTLQALGNWRSLGMVERYSHLRPEHLRSAVEKLVKSPGQSAPRDRANAAGSTELPATELRRNFESQEVERRNAV